MSNHDLDPIPFDDDDDKGGDAFNDFLNSLDFDEPEEEELETAGEESIDIDPALKGAIDAALIDGLNGIDEFISTKGTDLTQDLGDIRRFVVLASTTLLHRYLKEDKHNIFPKVVFSVAGLKFLVVASIMLMQAAIKAIQTQDENPSGGKFSEVELTAVYEPRNPDTYGIIFKYADWKSQGDHTASGYNECIVDVDMLKNELIQLDGDEQASDGEKEALRAALDATERGISYLLVRDIHDSFGG